MRMYTRTLGFLLLHTWKGSLAQILYPDTHKSRVCLGGTVYTPEYVILFSLLLTLRPTDLWYRLHPSCRSLEATPSSRSSVVRPSPRHPWSSRVRAG